MIHVRAQLGILFLYFSESDLEAAIDRGWYKAMEVMIIRWV